MKKNIIIPLVFLFTFMQVQDTQAQIPILEIIKAGVKKVIKAIDLQIQKQQNKVIWLQNAQKTLENEMSKLKLDEIGDWVGKQKELYKDYYEELAKVKSIIAYYQRIRDITEKQVKLVDQYKKAWALVRSDQHFTADEIDYMGKVYTGIIDESVKNLDQIAMVVNSFATTMSDARRMEIINKAADKVDENYNDLTRFTNQNSMLSIQRAKSSDEASAVRKYYGL